MNNIPKKRKVLCTECGDTGILMVYTNALGQRVKVPCKNKVHKKEAK